jgi:predicted phosphodiesterase
MITSLYAPTRGIDFVAVTCVTDSSTPVRLSVPGGGETRWIEAEHAPIRARDGWYWRFALRDLTPGTRARVVAEQGAQVSRWLSVATLARPAGTHRLRLGIIADPHCTATRASTGSKRYADSYALFAQALDDLVRRGVHAVILAGDVTDDGSAEQLGSCRRLIAQCPVPVHPIIGNHDRHAERFLQAMNLERGYRSIVLGGVHLVLLHTQSASDLAPQSAQLRWLRTTLAEHPDLDTLVFSHYPLADHPYQARESSRCIHNWRAVAALLGRQPRVRAAFAGHKNLPTRTNVRGVAHVVCPQPIRTPCGYDVVDVYDTGLTRTIHEIPALTVLADARTATDAQERDYRYGLETARNFTLVFDDAQAPAPPVHAGGAFDAGL